MKIGNKAALEAVLSIIGCDESPRDDEFTVQDVCDAQGCSYDSAAGRLNRAVFKGELKVRKIRINGKTSNYYSRLEPPVIKPVKRPKRRVDF